MIPFAWFIMNSSEINPFIILLYDGGWYSPKFLLVHRCNNRTIYDLHVKHLDRSKIRFFYKVPYHAFSWRHFTCDARRGKLSLKESRTWYNVSWKQKARESIPRGQDDIYVRIMCYTMGPRHKQLHQRQQWKGWWRQTTKAFVVCLIINLSENVVTPVGCRVILL